MLPNNYGESAKEYIPTGASVLESPKSEIESADSSADSNANPTRIGVFVGAFSLVRLRSSVSLLPHVREVTLGDNIQLVLPIQFSKGRHQNS